MAILVPRMALLEGPPVIAEDPDSPGFSGRPLDLKCWGQLNP